MKKIFMVPLFVILTVIPMIAGAVPVAGEPVAGNAGSPTATVAPKYALKDAGAGDEKAALASYVKGAYNAVIKGINATSDEIDTLNTDITTYRNAIGHLTDGKATQDGTVATIKNATTTESINTSSVNINNVTTTSISATASGNINLSVPIMDDWTTDSLAETPVQTTASFTNLPVENLTMSAPITTTATLTKTGITGNVDVSEYTISQYGKNLYNPATRTDGYYIGADGVVAQGSGTFCYSALIPVKPNTNYMLSGIAGKSDNRRLHAYDSNGNWISQISFANTTAGNTYNIAGTTPNNCVYVRISIPMSDTNVQLEQGSTATPYEPYGGNTETINAHGKNLFNSAAYDDYYYILAASGQLAHDDNPSGGAMYCSTDYIPVKPNTTYFKSGNFGAGVQSYYDANKTYISHESKQNATFTTPANCYYVKCNLLKENAPWNTAQIEQGSTATTYEPYY